MRELTELSELMRNEMPAEFEVLPDIDLYMDQVLAFLSRKRVSARNGDELTSAMVNNYIKDGLVPRANGKKYTREHLVYLSLVARLKQVLSVRDMTALLRADMPESDHGAYYERFRTMLDGALSEMECAGTDGQALSSIALELALRSYVDKIACEYLIDKMTPPAEPKAKAEKNAKEKPGKDKAAK